MLDLVAHVQGFVVWLLYLEHFVDDLDPALTETAQRTWLIPALRLAW